MIIVELMDRMMEDRGRRDIFREFFISEKFSLTPFHACLLLIGCSILENGNMESIGIAREILKFA